MEERNFLEVTFVICNYNYSKYIERAVFSIYSQLKKNYKFSLIIVDDGSTDDSVDVILSLTPKFINRFKDFNIKICLENKGKLYRLNQVLPRVETEFVVILDSDDYLCSNFIYESYESFYKVKECNENIGFVFSNSILIDSNDDFISEGLSTSFDKELLLTTSYIPECAFTLTKSILSSLPYDCSIKTGTKFHKWNKICQQGWEGLHIKMPLFYYRMHDKNISGIGNKILNESKQKTHRLLSGYWTN